MIFRIHSFVLLILTFKGRRKINMCMFLITLFFILNFGIGYDKGRFVGYTKIKVLSFIHNLFRTGE